MVQSIEAPRRGIRRAKKLRRRWDRTFATLLLLSVAAALVSFVVVDRLVGQFSDAARTVDRKAAVTSRLRPALTNHIQTAHTFVDFGTPFRQAFLDEDQAVSVLFDEAQATFDEPSELAALQQARVEWDLSIGFVRPIAADPARAADPSAELGEDNPVHVRIVKNSQGVAAAMAELDGASHREMTRQLQGGSNAERNLLIVLGGVAAVSALFTLHVGRRMRREILVPVQQLHDSAVRFADGDLDHRVEVLRRDELGDLAVSFNFMAEAITAKHQQLSVQAFSDSLTGLPNRASFHREINGVTMTADELDPLPACVMFIDLDDFKLVNDGLGHDAGDDLLRQVAVRLQTAVRATDLLARLGGDEFAVLLPAPSEVDEALHVAERMLEMLAAPFRIDGVPVGIGASIGVAVRTASANSADLLVRQADVAMYAAKARGKNRCEVYDVLTHGALLESHGLSSDAAARPVTSSAISDIAQANGLDVPEPVDA
jgi:diguanylate cyclase (GGDEF)-like protein